SAAPEVQKQAFFSGWTRKEAYIKAIGDGLSRPLDSFGVGLLPGEPAGLLWSRYPEELQRWTLANVEVDSPYRAAVAVEARQVELSPLRAFTD
ncbi:MAG: 4'-phosphopantetheinyl transferase superfamily protein, partial [Candidatus Eremiobacterota bacterium]